MELSENTLTVLKNFASINQNLLVQEGNVLRTMSEARNVMARADVTEQFEHKFGVYDLNEFISSLDLVDKPRLKFEDEYVVIGDSTGRSQVKYFFSPEETLTSPSKDIKMPDTELEFELTSDTLNKLKKAASTLGHDEVLMTESNGVLKLSVVENQNSTSNAFSIDVPTTILPGVPFQFIMGIGNLKIIPGDYKVGISSKLISNFVHKELGVQYWIALEKSSTYGA